MVLTLASVQLKLGVMSISGMDAASSFGTATSAKALVKGLALVEVIAASNNPYRIAELVEMTGLPRATALRLLEVLCRTGVLRTDIAGAYTLGPRVVGWGQSFLNRLDMRAQAADLMNQLVEITDETCFLGVRDVDRVLYVAAVSSPQPVRPGADVGFRNPLHSTGIGKALLAGLAADEVRALLPDTLERRTDNTITRRADLLVELDRVRQQGHAVDDVENEEGVRCVAAPVRDHTGAVVGGLSVSAPAYRFSPKDIRTLTPEVVRITQELSMRLGYEPPALEGPASRWPSALHRERSTR